MSMTNSAPFPYLAVPIQGRWRESVSGRAPQEIDPHSQSHLRINAQTRLASAGSCFAQRISKALQATGFNYLVTEDGPPFLSADDKERLCYGQYTARFGNIYTPLQLLQLFRRAFGCFTPLEPVWRQVSGGFVDPFRPSIQPSGFSSESECLWDRQAHLNAVRKMFEQVDVFIFTLGLTESWLSKVDGAVFPACPGSPLGGTFDPSQHMFHNFSSNEVATHLHDFVLELKKVNPAAQIILTVSPVPLLATFEPRHVLQATTYSKAALRVACEETVRRFDHVHYFASYEIVTATGDSRSYFLSDLRSVSDSAVEHVISCFHRQFTGREFDTLGTSNVTRPSTEPSAVADKPVCDEDLVMAALADQAMRERSADGN